MIWQDDSLSVITLQSTRGNPEVVYTPIQTWMFAHMQYLELFWWTIWFVTLLTLFWRAVIKKEFSK